MRSRCFVYGALFSLVCVAVWTLGPPELRNCVKDGLAQAESYAAAMETRWGGENYVDTAGPNFREMSDQELWEELMQRAAENGGRLELDSRDPLGQEYFRRMQEGNGLFPHRQGGVDDLWKGMERLRRPGDAGDAESDDFDRMFEEMDRMFERLRSRHGPLPLDELMPELKEQGRRDGEREFHFGPHGFNPDRLRDLMSRREEARDLSRNEKNHDDVKKVYRDVVARASECTVRVLAEGKQVVLGTVVTNDGHVLTKASQLKDDVAVAADGGKPLPAEVVGIHQPFDLALLKVEGLKAKPIDWAAKGLPDIGALVASPDATEGTVATGVISVAARRPVEARGFLGIGHEETAEGVAVTAVVPDTAAARAGIVEGDIIEAVDGRAVTTSMDLIQKIGRRNPGDRVELKIRRGNKTRTVKTELGRREFAMRGGERLNFMNHMGTRLSERRDGFPLVLQHDSFLRPEDCGGPLVDLSGQAVGVNIARAGRVESYAAPATAVQPILAEMLAGKLAPPKRDVAEKLDDLEAALQRAHAAKNTAEMKAQQIEEELRRLEKEKADLEKRIR